MENPSHRFVEALRPAGRIDRVTQLREEWRLARSAHRDLQILRMGRMNVLLTGEEGPVENVLDMLRPNLRAPIRNWQPNDRLALPLAEVGTMILRDVGALPPDDQHRLLEWLDLTAGRTQVVSTTTASLLARVRAGEFLDTLYYRLNTVCVDATP